MAKPKFEKRIRTMGAIATAALATGGGSATPTPMLELPKQVAIAAGDLTLCATIFTIWFDESVSRNEMREILLDAGFATIAAGTLVYGGVKLTETVLAEGFNLMGPLGWGFKAIITSTVTGMVGFMFWKLCESPPEWLKAKVADTASRRKSATATSRLQGVE